MFDSVKYTHNLLEAVLGGSDIHQLNEGYDEYNELAMYDLMEDIEFGMELLENEVFDAQKNHKSMLLNAGVGQNSKVEKHTGYKNQSAVANHLYGNGPHKDNGLLDQTRGLGPASSHGAIQIVHKDTGRHIATIAHSYNYGNKDVKNVYTHDAGEQQVGKSKVFDVIKDAVNSHPDAKGDWKSLEVRHVGYDSTMRAKRAERNTARRIDYNSLHDPIIMAMRAADKLFKKRNLNSTVNHHEIVSSHAKAIADALTNNDYYAAREAMYKLDRHIAKTRESATDDHSDKRRLENKYRRFKIGY